MVCEWSFHIANQSIVYLWWCLACIMTTTWVVKCCPPIRSNRRGTLRRIHINIISEMIQDCLWVGRQAKSSNGIGIITKIMIGGRGVRPSDELDEWRLSSRIDVQYKNHLTHRLTPIYGTLSATLNFARTCRIFCCDLTTTITTSGSLITTTWSPASNRLQWRMNDRHGQLADEYQLNLWRPFGAPLPISFTGEMSSVGRVDEES